MLNKNSISHQRLYSEDVKILMEDVDVKGSTIADKIHDILIFYIDNHGKSILEMALEDAGFIEKLSDKILKNGRNE